MTGLTLGIYGDSYAHALNQEIGDPDRLGQRPWSGQVQDIFGDNSHVMACPGTNIWWSINHLLSDIELHGHIENVVFVWSNPWRIPYVDEKYASKSFIQPGSYDFNRPTEDPEFMKAIEYFYKFFHSNEMQEFYNQAVFDYLQEYLKERKVNLVNVMPFTYSGKQHPTDYNKQVDLSKRSGSVITGIQNVSFIESGSIAGYQLRNDFHTEWIGDTGVDNRCCHLNAENNNLLANLVLDMLDNNNNRVIDFYNDWAWVGGPERWSWYNRAPWIENYDQ